jgi:NTP pyrophosphatase (non-canonical NTP hydrolase)
MSDTLVRLLSDHQPRPFPDSGFGCTGCTGRFVTRGDHARHVADLIAGEHLVVPRSDDIAVLARFLNARNGKDLAEMTAQMLKLSEEAGEVAAAWIGYLGQNPRKGVTHSKEDVLSELADVAITAMVAIARLGGDPDSVVSAKAAVMRQRYEALKADSGRFQ